MAVVGVTVCLFVVTVVMKTLYYIFREIFYVYGTIVVEKDRQSEPVSSIQSEVCKVSFHKAVDGSFCRLCALFARHRSKLGVFVNKLCYIGQRTQGHP